MYAAYRVLFHISVDFIYLFWCENRLCKVNSLRGPYGSLNFISVRIEHKGVEKPSFYCCLYVCWLCPTVFTSYTHRPFLCCSPDKQCVLVYYSIFVLLDSLLTDSNYVNLFHQTSEQKIDGLSNSL